MDVDAVDILVKCSLLTGHREAEVKQALSGVFNGLVRNQAEDGGFCRARLRPLPAKGWKRRVGEMVGLDRILRKPYQPPREIWYYNGWRRLPFDIRIKINAFKINLLFKNVVHSSL